MVLLLALKNTIIEIITATLVMKIARFTHQR